MGYEQSGFLFNLGICEINGNFITVFNEFIYLSYHTFDWYRVSYRFLNWLIWNWMSSFVDMIQLGKSSMYKKASTSVRGESRGNNAVCQVFWGLVNVMFLRISGHKMPTHGAMNIKGKNIFSQLGHVFINVCALIKGTYKISPMCPPAAATV